MHIHFVSARSRLISLRHLTAALLTSSALVGIAVAVTTLASAPALASGGGGFGGGVYDGSSGLGGTGGSDGNGTDGNAGGGASTGGAGGSSPGANGSDGTADASRGGGGGGGASGADVNFTTLNNTGTVTGGAGGTGGAGASTGGGGGGGGGGGDIIVTGTGTMSNSGSLTGGAGGNGGSSDGGSFLNSGGGNGGAGVIFTMGGVTFTNASSGTITGGAGGNSGTGATSGNAASTASGGAGIVTNADMAIVNAGTITGGTSPNGSSYAGAGISINSGALSLTNSGAILSANTAISNNGSLVLINQAGNGTSTGVIQGGSIGILSDTTGTFTVTNSGAIISASEGVRILNGDATITNNAGDGTTTGVISGNDAITSYGATASLTVNNAGTITAVNNGFYTNGATTITNSGAILGTGTYGVAISTGTGGIDSVTLTNMAGNGATTGIVKGTVDGLFVNGALNITNFGAIIGGTDRGIWGAAAITIVNNAGDGVTTGLISGGTTGIFGPSNTAAVMVTNAGTITGGSYGIYSEGATTITNSGGIFGTGGNGTAINTGSSGIDSISLTNLAGNGVTTGIVSGTVNGIYAYGAVDITNSGAIIGGSDRGISGGAAVTVVNNAGDGVTTGLISGGTTGIYGVSSSDAMTVTNAGTITGGTDGILANGVATISNTGTISGQSGIGVNVFGDGSSVFNAGTITGTGSAAIKFWGNGNTLTLGTSSVINGNVYAGGSDTLQLGGTGSATFDVSQLGSSGQYQGFATFNKIDSAIWTLTGAPNQATSWNINGGTLSVSADASLGTGNEDLSFNGGILQVTGTSFTSTTRNINWGANGGGFDIADAANVFTLSQALTGTGGLTKAGLGTLVLTGANTYTGATLVNAGTLRQGVAGAFSTASAYMVASGATLDFGGFDTSFGSLAGAGNLSIGTATLTVGSDNTSTAFSGTISGSGGFIKTGTGRLNLTGTSSYTGATTIDGGILSVNGDITSSSGVTVNAGGTLGGNGFVGNTTINGGTLSPGNSIGLLTVVGNLVLTSASSYMVEVSTAAADRVNVTGTATLGGATVKTSFAAGSYIAKQYTILNATGGVSGTFSGLVNSNLPSTVSSSLSYDANDVYLNLKLNFGIPSGLNANQARVGDTLTAFFNRTGGIAMDFAALSASGLTQVSGETATGGQQTTFNAMTQFMTLMSDPFTAGRGFDAPNAPAYADETPRRPTDAFAMMTKAPPKNFEARWNVWASGFGGSQTTDGAASAGSSGATSSIAGVAVGADYLISPNTVAGFSVAGAGTSFSVANAGSGRSDLFQAGGFVRHSVALAYVTASAAYGWQDVTTDRTVTVAGIDRLHAEYKANSYSARLEGGNRYVTSWLGGVGLTPYIAAQLIAFDLPSYAESATSGASTFALAYAGKTVTSPRSELGLRGDKSFAVNDAILTLRGRAAWAHDYTTDRSVAATFQTLPGASFIVSGAAPAHDAALTTASAEMKFVNGITLAATFEGEFSDVTRSYAGKGTVRYGW